MARSGDKGTRAEYAVRDLLRKATGLDWERVPGSGGYNAAHGLKGDVYLPPATGKMATFAIEVKHYKDDVINSNLLKENKNPSILWDFWLQTQREAEEMNMKPLLVFKKDRGKWLAGMLETDVNIIDDNSELCLSLIHI